MRIPQTSKEEQLAVIAVELAGQAVAAKMRGGITVAGFAILENGEPPAHYTSGVLIMSDGHDDLWIFLAGLWACERFNLWVEDQRPLAEIDLERRRELCETIHGILSLFELSPAEIAGIEGDFGFSIIELETVWPVVLEMTEYLVASVDDEKLSPTEEHIVALLDSVELTPGQLLEPLADVLGWTPPPS